MLLTSGGITTPSIRSALDGLLETPVDEARALLIPTAAHAQPGGTDAARRVIVGDPESPLADIGWDSVGVLELTALPTVPRERWVTAVEQADALLAHGGDPLYLAYWMRRSGLADLLPALDDTVWVGLSAGSMVMTPQIGRPFVDWVPPDDGVIVDDRTLGLVDVAIFPHLDNPALPSNTRENAERWFRTVDVPAYVLDDESALRVVDGEVEVVSEGRWAYLEK